MKVYQRGRDLAASGFRLARQEILILAVIFLSAGGLWVFLGIAEEVNEGETVSFDRSVVLALRAPGDTSDPLGPIWLESVFRDITALGSNFVLSFITIAVIGFLLMIGKRGAALLVFVAVVGGAILGDGLKLLFARPRPDLVPHGVPVYTASFPSNHAMGAAVTYLTLGALLARFQVRRRVKAYFLAVAVLLVVLVGCSRVYLGVHWPTDVLAGWAVGAAWAMGVWLVALILQRRGKVEPPDSS